MCSYLNYASLAKAFNNLFRGGLFIGLFIVLPIILLVASQTTLASTVEPQSGEMEFLVMTDNGSPTALPGLHIESKATISINGMIATVEVEQRFQNSSNEWVEGRYVYPLPEDAAVNAMEMLIGERLIKATIKEKQEAQKIYQAAKAAGKKTGLLEQHRPNLFSQTVANIAPKENITVKLRYIQTITYQNDAFSLRFPMTITPRYIPGIYVNKNQADISSSTQTESNNIEINQQSGWGSVSPTDQVVDADLITPQMVENTSSETHLINPIELNITLDAGLPLASIDSAYHSISVSKTDSQHSIHLSKGKVSMDRDFVLSWQPVEAAAPTAALFSETIDGDDYSLIMLMPPKQMASQHTINKEIIFIIDTSGSMGGTSIQQAKAGLAHALKQLHKNDKFNIIEFNSDLSLLYPHPLMANTHNINQALFFVERLQANGGTEILPALNAAFLQTRNASEKAHEKNSEKKHKNNYLKQIIFITDGSVGNEAALFKSIHDQLGSTRLFTVGIGSAPNSYFMKKAAEFGRGSFTYIGDVNEVKEKMQILFSKINNPSMRDITIEDIQGRPLELFPNPIPDLYQGEPLIAAIRKDYETEALIIKGTYQQKTWQKIVNFNHGKNHKGVASVWARKKIENLLDKERTEGKQENIKQHILSIALQHQLMSPYTSFVAVEEMISRPQDKILEKKEAPNLTAKGQQIQNVNYPQTATPLWFNLLSGLIALISVGVLHFKTSIKVLTKKYSHKKSYGLRHA